MDMELNLLGIWKLIKQRMWLIAGITAGAVLIAGLTSYFVLKPQYEAKSTILVQNQKSNDQMVYNDLMANQQLVKTYSDIIKSKRIAEDVKKRLSLTMSDDDLLKKVQVETANQSLVTTVTVTDQDPKTAVAIANGVADAFNDNINKIMKVDNVSILDKAKLEDSSKQVSPRPMLNMAIAFVLGLMLSIGIVFLIEFMDNTVKSEEEIQELLDLPVLGVIAVIGEEDKKKSKARNKSVANRGATNEL
ncbi:MAG: YveK family protein [Tumebacillaceae bacterium]